MRKVNAVEAKARLAELLREVERGETVDITRHGKTVAQLVSASAQDRAGRAKAVEEFRRSPAGWKRIIHTTDEIVASRHEGHHR